MNDIEQWCAELDDIAKQLDLLIKDVRGMCLCCNFSIVFIVWLDNNQPFVDYARSSPKLETDTRCFLDETLNDTIEYHDETPLSILFHTLFRLQLLFYSLNEALLTIPLEYARDFFEVLLFVFYYLYTKSTHFLYFAAIATNQNGVH
jgi:hypothetical protein